MNGEPLCGVVIVHYGDPGPTRRCLAAVLRDPSSIRRRTVVVDNSANLSLDSPLPEGVQHLDAPHNPGFGGGAHLGVAALPDETSFYLVLNHDIEIQPGYLDAARQALADASVGAAAGPIYLDRPNGPLWSAGGEVRFLTGTVRQYQDPQRASQRREVGFLPGAAFVIRREAWQSTGGFDRRIFLYNEDVDLCLRLRRAEWRLRFEPRMVAVHHLGQATGSGEASALYLEELTANRLRPFRGLPHRLYLAVIHTGYVFLRAAALLARHRRAGLERVRALLRGHGRALRHLTDEPMRVQSPGR